MFIGLVGTTAWMSWRNYLSSIASWNSLKLWVGGARLLVIWTSSSRVKFIFHVFLKRTEQLFSQQFPGWANSPTQSSLPKATEFMAQILSVPKKELLSPSDLFHGQTFQELDLEVVEMCMHFLCVCWVFGIFFSDLIGKMKPYELSTWAIWASSFLHLYSASLHRHMDLSLWNCTVVIGHESYKCW